MEQLPPNPARRREGFPGQHLVVIPSPTLADIASDPLLMDLFPTATGRFPYAAGHFVKRQTGIEDFILILVQKGCGWIRSTEKREAKAGQVCLIPAGVPHSYGADEANPWAIQWVHFRGRSAGAFSELLSGGLSPAVLLPEAPERLEFGPLFECLEMGYTRKNLLTACTRLRVLLTELHRQMEIKSSSGEAIRESLRWMQMNLGHQTTLHELARAAGLSVPHYCHLFKRATGVPPIEHFLRLKIQRACQRLDTTGLRVQEIAAELGWDDPYYFSRFFRRITGKSPRSYRLIPKG